MQYELGCEKNTSLRFPSRSGSLNQPAQLQRQVRILKFCMEHVSGYGTSKALIRLHRCAGWSMPLFFSIQQCQFSSIEARLIPQHAGLQKVLSEGVQLRQPFWVFFLVDEGRTDDLYNTKRRPLLAHQRNAILMAFH